MKGIAKVACRVISIVLVVQFLSSVPTMLMFVASYPAQPGGGGVLLTMLGMVGGILAYPLIALVLWVFSDDIASRMIGKDEEAAQNVTIGVKGLESVAFPILGVWVLVIAVSGIATSVTGLFSLTQQMRGDMPGIGGQYVAPIVGSSLQFLIGAVLFFGSKAVIRVLKAGREYGEHRATGDASQENHTV